jgi:hypothetical protein
MSGALSLYAMDWGGSVPEPLLPPNIALQNPELMDGYSFYVFPQIGSIIVMIDHDGDENYQPMLIPLDGGIPRPAFGDAFASHRVHLGHCDPDSNLVYLGAESREQAMIEAFVGNLATGELEKLRESKWGSYVDGVSEDNNRVTMIDGYTAGDLVLYLWERGQGVRLLYGKPLEERAPGEQVQPHATSQTHFVSHDCSLLCITALFSDTYSLGYIDLANPEEVRPVTVSGAVHSGVGEMIALHHLEDNRFTLGYNIDGASWL